VQHDASRAGKAERAKDGASVDRGTSEKSEGANKKAKEEVGGLGWAAVYDICRVQAIQNPLQSLLRR